MACSISRARLTAMAALACAFLSPAAMAADMPPFEPPPAEEPVEWGTGWYLRGDVGGAYASPRDLNGVLLSPDFPNNWTVGLGGGYQFNNWLRGDITLDYESFYAKAGGQSAFVPCQIGARLWDPAIDNPPNTGSVGVFSACTPFTRNRTESMLALANAYLDLGNWYGFTPYVGAGLGVNVLYQKAQVNWFMLNGVPYSGTTWTDPFTLGTYMANWDTTLSGTFLRFAYAFMGGVAYDLTDHIKADLGYRYVNLGKIEGVDTFRNRVAKDLTAHQVRIGFRYVID